MKNNSLIRDIVILLGIILIIVLITMLLSQKSCENEQDDDKVVFPSTVEQREGEPYKSPIDWEDEQSKNPDIYAWLYIPDTEISFPIVMRDGDDKYYIEHSAYLREYSGGAIFAESKYNSRTFDDPVYLLYGHKMRSGAMLGTLQTTYSSREGFDSHREIIIYMPDKELHYKVWAATPYEPYHILARYDMNRIRFRNMFLEEVKSIRSIDGIVDEEMDISYNDKLLVISTCLMGKVSKRYILISRLETVIE